MLLLVDHLTAEMEQFNEELKQVNKQVKQLKDELPKETQDTVSRWAEETFGPASSNARVAARANEEMAELLRALTADDNSPRAVVEIADVVIILYRLATRLRVDLHTAVDEKMRINRSRQWRLDGSGHGYHVREKEKP